MIEPGLLGGIAILAVSIPITVGHELAHYLVASGLGLPVQELSIGVGKSVYSLQVKSTVFTVRQIPFAGYVKFGEKGNSAIARRLIVLFAGPLANVLMALALYLLSVAINFPGILNLENSSSFWAAFGERIFRLGLDRSDPFAFAASLSRTYALLNLLPLYGFDGGEILSLLVRAFVKRKEIANTGSLDV